LSQRASFEGEVLQGNLMVDQIDKNVIPQGEDLRKKPPPKYKSYEGERAAYQSSLKH